jgi:DNA replication protein DnaC
MKTPSFDDLMKQAAKDALDGKTFEPPPEEPPKQSDLLDVPDRYREAKIPSDLKDHESLYLWSSEPGTGKTYIAWAYYIHHRLKYTKEKPLFSLFSELQIRLRATMNGGIEQEDNIVKDFCTRRLVVLDDISGLRQGDASDYSLQIIHMILEKRYSWKRQTIITSNKNIGDISTQFDARIASRVAGMCRMIELSGQDRRLTDGNQ